MSSRQRDYRERMKAQGLAQVTVWARPEHHDQIRQLAAELSVTSDTVTSDKPPKTERPVTSDKPAETVTSDTVASDIKLWPIPEFKPSRAIKKPETLGNYWASHVGQTIDRWKLFLRGQGLDEAQITRRVVKQLKWEAGKQHPDKGGNGDYRYRGLIDSVKRIKQGVA